MALGEGDSEAQAVPEAVPAARLVPVTEADLETECVAESLLLEVASAEGLATQGE